jgi:glycosyltransferase involved in cell wall biosynthesis
MGLSEEDYVILATGESTPPAAHERAVWSVGILNVLDPKYKLLLWGRGPRVPSLRRFARKLGQPDMLLLAEQQLRRKVEFEELLTIADLALVTASEPAPTLPVLITMAAGLPIVSTVTPELTELLEDGYSALLMPKATPKLIARRILDMREDPSLQSSTTQRARTEACEFFSPTKFLHDWREIYRSA